MGTPIPEIKKIIEINIPVVYIENVKVPHIARISNAKTIARFEKWLVGPQNIKALQRTDFRCEAAGSISDKDICLVGIFRQFPLQGLKHDRVAYQLMRDARFNEMYFLHYEIPKSRYR
jgi:hypothetical protein